MTRRALDYLHDLNEELNYMFFLDLVEVNGDDITLKVIGPSGSQRTLWATMKTPVDRLSWMILDLENEKAPVTN